MNLIEYAPEIANHNGKFESLWQNWRILPNNLRRITHICGVIVARNKYCAPKAQVGPPYVLSIYFAGLISGGFI